MKKIGLFCVTTLVAVGAALPALLAAGPVLHVTPHRVVITPQERVQTVSVANQSDETVRYTARTVDHVMAENGDINSVDDFDYSAKRIIRYVPRSFTLAPGARQVVRIMAQRTPDLPDGDYHTHLLFREEADKKKADVNVEKGADGGVRFEIGTVYGIGVPVIVQNGRIESSLVLQEARVSEAGDALQVTINRLGNAEGSAYLKVDYGDGEGAGASTHGRWVKVYRERDTVNLTFAPEADKGAPVAVVLYESDDDDAAVLSRLAL